jgi:hypothetical protein
MPYQDPRSLTLAEPIKSFHGAVSAVILPNARRRRLIVEIQMPGRCAGP